VAHTPPVAKASSANTGSTISMFTRVPMRRRRNIPNPPNRNAEWRIHRQTIV
jgi:hypothetical protein